MTDEQSLVAERQDSTTVYSGIGIVESAVDLHNGIASGSWVEGGLGLVGGGLEILSLAIDPVGTLLSYGVSWLIEHIKPLSDALDWLAGDGDTIASYAQTWRNVSQAIGQARTAFDTAVRNDTAAWTGAAADAYRAQAAGQSEHLGAAATSAGTIGTVVEVVGVLVGMVREIVRDLVADCIATLIARIPQWLVETAGSLGMATPHVVASAATLIAKWVARIAKVITKLVRSIENLRPLLRNLDKLWEAIRSGLRGLTPGGPSAPGTTPGGTPDAPSTAPNPSSVDTPTVTADGPSTTSTPTTSPTTVSDTPTVTPNGTTPASTPSSTTTPVSSTPTVSPDGPTASSTSSNTSQASANPSPTVSPNAPTATTAQSAPSSSPVSTVDGPNPPSSTTPQSATVDGPPPVTALDSTKYGNTDLPVNPPESPPPPGPGNRVLGIIDENRVTRDGKGLITHVDGKPVKQYLRDLAQQRMEAYQAARRPQDFVTDDVGPVVSLAFDSRRGVVLENSNGRIDSALDRTEVHPLIRERLEAMERPQGYQHVINGTTYTKQYPHIEDYPLRHAEVKALDWFLKDRERMGLPVDARVLDELRVDTFNWQQTARDLDGNPVLGADGKPAKGAFVGCCASCTQLLEGVPNSAGKHTGFPPSRENLVQDPD